MNNSKIRQVLEKELITWASSLTNPVPVFSENVLNSLRTKPSLYIVCKLVPSKTKVLSLSGDVKTLSGVFRVFFIGTLNEGIKKIEELSSEFINEFHADRTFFAADFSIVLHDEPSALESNEEGGNVKIPVFLAYACNNIFNVEE